MLSVLAVSVSSAGAQTQVERWKLVPDLKVGSVFGSVTLTDVSSLVVGPDGTMYVAQPTENTIRVISANGRVVGKIGQAGSGPGEFRGLFALGWVRDTLYAIDATLQRVSFFKPNGEHIRTSRLVIPAPGRPWIPGVISALSSDGSAVGRPRAPARLLAGGKISRMPVLEVTRGGTLVDTLAWISPLDKVMAVASGIVQSYRNRPIYRQTLWDVSQDGSRFVFVDRPPPESDGAATFRVTVVSTNADTILSKRYRYTPAPVPEAVADSLVSADIQRIRKRFANLPPRFPSVPVPERDDIAEAFDIPEYYPPIENVVVGRDGTIWLRRADAGRDTAVWNVLNARGDVIAVVEAPKRLTILQAERGRVWGVVRDELDVPYVVRYRIRAQGGS